MMWNIKDILTKTLLIFLGITTFVYAQEPLTEFSEETLPILNQQLKKLEDAQVWERDSVNTQIELIEEKDLDMQSKDILFEGATADAYETTLTTTDPTADRTITIPDATGTIALAGATVISSTRAMDAASEDVPYTGVGFTPTATIILAGDISTGPKMASWGFTDGTTSGSLNQEGNTGNIKSSANLIVLTEEPGKEQAAVLKSLDSDGLTLTWTKTGSPTSQSAELRIICFR